jgi:hypothetical protein
MVPKNLDTIGWSDWRWFDWSELPLRAVSVEGLVQMKRAAGRDQDLIDLRNLGFPIAKEPS